MMCAAAFAGAFLGTLAVLAIESIGNGGSALTLNLSVVAVVSLVHGMTTMATWSALENDTSPVRAIVVAAGAATVWLVGLLTPLAVWFWVMLPR